MQTKEHKIMPPHTPIKVASSSKTVRSSNLELLRIGSILLIIAMHVIGYAASKRELSTDNTYFIYFVGAVGNLGVSCFVLLSGYFGVKFSWKKFVYISLLTTAYAILCTFCNNDFRITGDVLMAVLWVPRYFNWYITCYLALLLLSGYVNDFCSRLDNKRFTKLLAVLFVLLSVLPMFVSATDVVLNKSGQCLMYFLYAYMIGRFVRLHKDVMLSRWLTGGVVVAMVLIMWLKGIASMKVGVLSQIPLTSNYSPTILIASVAALYLFKSFNIQSRFINYISASVLAAYLLDQLKPTIDRHICVYLHTQDTDFALYVMLEVFTVFCIAIFIDKVRIHLLYKPETWITNVLVAFCVNTSQRINKFI